MRRESRCVHFSQCIHFINLLHHNSFQPAAPPASRCAPHPPMPRTRLHAPVVCALAALLRLARVRRLALNVDVDAGRGREAKGAGHGLEVQGVHVEGVLQVVRVVGQQVGPGAGGQGGKGGGG